MKRRNFLTAITAVSAVGTVRAVGTSGAALAAVVASPMEDLLRAPLAWVGEKFSVVAESCTLTLVSANRVGDTRLQQWHLRFSVDGVLPEGIHSLRSAEGARCELFLQSNVLVPEFVSAQLSRFA